MDYSRLLYGTLPERPSRVSGALQQNKNIPLVPQQNKIRAQKDRTACYESPSTKYPEFFRAIFAAFDFGR